MDLDVIGQLLQQNILLEARGGLSVKTHVIKGLPYVAVDSRHRYSSTLWEKFSFFFGKMPLFSFSTLLETTET